MSEMSQGPAERLETLASFVPDLVRRHLLPAAGAPARPSAVRLPAALLLVDITGFTPLTAAAVRRGAAGTEALSRSLNAYFGRLMDVIEAYGGDVAKVVGDALIPVWAAETTDLAAAATRAAACGLELAGELAEVELEVDLRLSLKVGLCAGGIVASRIGGLDDRWLFLLAGDAMAQLAPLEPRLETGRLVASPEAWRLVSSAFVGQTVETGHALIRPGQRPPAGGAGPEPSPASSRTPEAPIPIDPATEAPIRGFVPPVYLPRLDAGQTDWIAELRRTTVVFADIRGVGAATDGDLARLEDVTTAAQETVRRYDGWLKEVTVDEKGTTLVAVLGVPPASHEDDPARGIEVALALQAKIQGLGLTAGLGVATGPAFCGPVGDRRRRDFIVLGQHVNLAARLMQAAGDDGVLCDAETRAAAGPKRSFDRLAAYVLKGMTTPIDVFRVRVADRVAGERAGMVDRRTELGTAIDSLDALRAGSGGIVVFEGEPGIGKSRLVEEVRRTAVGGGVRVVTGSAAEIEESTPYYAWRVIFERLLGLEAETDLAARRTRVLGRLGDGSATRLAPLLDPILSLDLRDNEVTSALPSETRADNTRDLLVGILREEAASQPMLVVLEDVHWLDSASWSLIRQVSRDLTSVLLVITSRPVASDSDDPLSSVRSDATTLHLGPLPRDDALALACERAGATRLSDGVAALVHDRAEGNPLFIEQLTYAMRDSGRVVVESGVLRPAAGVDDLTGTQIPDTVQRVITTRLDQLPPGEAMTLKVASVIGQRFAIRTLADIYPIPTETETLLEHLATLQRLDLVAASPAAPEPTYEFRHVITQEVAYNLMLGAQSQQLHERLAAWYERTYAADLSPFHTLLAYHWRRAGQASRAVDHLEAAGVQALRTFANEEAIGFLEQAVALVADARIDLEPARRARWELELGEAFVHMSRYREGRVHLETGLRLMDRAAPASQLDRLLSVLGEIARQGLRRLGLIRGIRTLDDQQREDLIASFRALERLAEASYYSRETLVPLYCVVRILNEAEASGIPAEISRGYAGTGALFGVVPLPRVARWYLDRAAARLEEVQDETTHEIVGVVIGFCDIGAARWEPAREWFRTVRRLARRLGDRRRLDDAVGNLMELEYLRGSFRTSLDLADELVASASARNDQRFRAEGLVGTAYCAWQLGDAEVAMRAVATIRSLVSDSTDLTEELRIRVAGLLALIHLGRGERPQALAASDEAMRLTAGQRPTYFGTYLGHVGPAEVYLDALAADAPSSDARARASDAIDRLRRFAKVFPFARPRAQTLAGRYRWLVGDQRGALSAWRDAVASAETLDMPFERGLAHLELGRHLPPDDRTRAEHLAAARAVFEELGARPALEATDAAAAGRATGPPVGR